MCTTSLHILCVLRWSETKSSARGFLWTASLHIFYVLKRSRTNANEHGSMHTALSHISFVLRCSGTSFIHSWTFTNRDILINTLSPGEVKIYSEVVILCQIILKQLSVISTASSRLLTCTNPSHDQDAKRQARVLLLFVPSGPAFLMAFVPLDKLIIIAIVIVSVPYIYLFLCYKPIRDRLQQPWIHAHCLIAHFLCFKVIRDIGFFH